MKIKRVGVTDLSIMKAKGEKIAAITAYNAPFAKLVDEANIDVILVGDSMGMVELGYDSTIPVTFEDMLQHVKAVTRNVQRALVVADIPFGTFEASDEQAITTCIRLIKEGGAQAVKIEGGNSLVQQRIKSVIDAGIPVMGHLGLTPQTASLLGGYKVQGKNALAAQKILEQAKMLEKIGIFSLVFECMPAELLDVYNKELTVPTIGIGAGAACDGQFQVIHDILGLSSITPKHAKCYVNLYPLISEALIHYKDDVKNGEFPTEENTFHMNHEELDKLY